MFISMFEKLGQLMFESGEKELKAILKARWAIIVLWLAAAVMLFLFAPSMSDLVREKGQLSVPDGYTSSRAAEILKEASGGVSGETLHQVALVFNKPDGLSESDKESIREGVQALNDNKESLHIDSINEPFTQTELEDTLIAKTARPSWSRFRSAAARKP